MKTANLILVSLSGLLLILVIIIGPTESRYLQQNSDVTDAALTRQGIFLRLPRCRRDDECLIGEECRRGRCRQIEQISNFDQ